jgi:hypothetical protein
MGSWFLGSGQEAYFGREFMAFDEHSYLFWVRGILHFWLGKVPFDTCRELASSQ